MKKNNKKPINSVIAKIERKRTIKRYIKNIILSILLMTAVVGLFDFAFKQWDSEIQDISKTNQQWVETYTK